MENPHKRSRSASASSDSLSAPPSPSTKVYRSSSPSRSNWTCTLPPTCDRTPSTFSTSDTLEAHHRIYHAFVCTAPPSTFDFAIGQTEKRRYRYSEDGGRERICGRVFPDERMLGLHLTECHDELAHLKHERGEKIARTPFHVISHAEMLTLARSPLFSIPKKRRLHLINQHGYPAQYYFSVTVWGVEDVLKKGGGMVRRAWKPREGQERGRGSSEETLESPPSPALERRDSPPHFELPPAVSSCADVDELAAALSGASISLVPRSVRLARKNKMLA
ncbi:hypothetical protein JCM10295v2_005065 [Rhodotorula toruloides]